MTATLAPTSPLDLPSNFVDAPFPPPWVARLTRPAALRSGSAADVPLEVRVAAGDAFSSVGVALPGVGTMDRHTLERSVVACYRTVFAELAAMSTPQPVRFWAFVPDIHADMGEGLDRYMVFNAGRFTAYSDWCGGGSAIARSVATGSAVGVGGDRLLIHCVASREAGTPVENPRQIPAYRYSRRFGPLPPCFSRATLLREEVPGGGRLLVGGTASIRGERTLHVGDVTEQTRETLANLASLVRSACEPEAGEDPELQLAPWLSRFRELRAYLPAPRHAEVVLGLVSPYFDGVRCIEMLQADLCRSELLVELEGVADLGPFAPGPA